MLTDSRNNVIVQTRTEVGKTATTGFDFRINRTFLPSLAETYSHQRFHNNFLLVTCRVLIFHDDKTNLTSSRFGINKNYAS
jgi:hypothetical protein